MGWDDEDACRDPQETASRELRNLLPRTTLPARAHPGMRPNTNVQQVNTADAEARLIVDELCAESAGSLRPWFEDQLHKKAHTDRMLTDGTNPVIVSFKSRLDSSDAWPFGTGIGHHLQALVDKNPPAMMVAYAASRKFGSREELLELVAAQKIRFYAAPASTLLAELDDPTSSLFQRHKATNLHPQNLTKHACTFPAALVDMLRGQLAQPSRPLTLEEATEGAAIHMNKNSLGIVKFFTEIQSVLGPAFVDWSFPKVPEASSTNVILRIDVNKLLEAHLEWQHAEMQEAILECRAASMLNAGGIVTLRLRACVATAVEDATSCWQYKTHTEVYRGLFLPMTVEGDGGADVLLVMHPQGDWYIVKNASKAAADGAMQTNNKFSDLRWLTNAAPALQTLANHRLCMDEPKELLLALLQEAACPDARKLIEVVAPTIDRTSTRSENGQKGGGSFRRRRGKKRSLLMPKQVADSRRRQQQKQQQAGGG